MIRPHVLEREQWVPSPPPVVFDFFSNAKNLEHLTPPWLKFSILTLPIAMEAGTSIHYRIRWRGVPLRWTTEIETWDPPSSFVDLQLSGPYKLWHHTHEFEAANGGTRLLDVVRYALPLGPLGNVAHALWVRRDIENIFDYRRDRIAERFGIKSVQTSPQPL